MRSTTAMWILSGTAVLSTYSAAAFGGHYFREAALIAADQRPEDRLGHSLAVSEDTIFAGAIFQDSGGDSCGAVYVYERIGDEWIQQAKLLPDDPTSFLLFGYSLGYAGDTLFVGTPTDSRPGGHASGSAYVFTRVDGVWTQQAKLIAPDPSPEALFGSSVAIWGDVAVVGAPQQNNQTGDGKAYVFQRTGSSWQHVTTLVALDGDIGDAFGLWVGVSENRILIGAPQDDNAAGIDAGAAYLFSETDGNWVQTVKLIGSHTVDDSKFGHSVAISGNTLLVASYQESYSALEYAGAVYVFEDIGGVWEQTSRITPNEPRAGDFFGAAIAIRGDELLAGARGRRVGGAETAGTVFRFRRVSGSWRQTQEFSETNRERRLGEAVALSSTRAVLGHWKDAEIGPSAGTPAGAIWVYSNESVAPSLCPADLNGNGVVDLTDLAILLASFGATCL